VEYITSRRLTDAIHLIAVTPRTTGGVIISVSTFRPEIAAAAAAATNSVTIEIIARRRVACSRDRHLLDGPTDGSSQEALYVPTTEEGAAATAVSTTVGISRARTDEITADWATTVETVAFNIYEVTVPRTGSSVIIVAK
jgi:hypothetical protein